MRDRPSHHRWPVCFCKPPLVLGHEIAGIVEQTGPAARKLAAGDYVKCVSVVGCGHCSWCLQGATQVCPTGSELGITADGDWAEWLVFPERNLPELPDAERR